MTDIAKIAAGLTKAQREALIACVDALSWCAGEGYEIAENAIYGLACAFNMPEHLTYEEWVRSHIQENTDAA